MKTPTKLMGLAAALVLIAGCSRSAETTASSDASRDTTVANAPATNALSPTSRELDSKNRVYPDAANSTNAADTSSLKAADNTGKNVRDRDNATLTPGDQGKSESDREITRNIRRAITKNDQLSTEAKNIKIITVDGKVTLRGPVKSDQELKTISDVVQNVANGAAVDNQLEVKTDSSAK
ncbi:BON domain-containing protein [Pedosphaera parvula]|nr:BON domain-containing protein [Pedosphaera parvula]